MAEQAVNRTIMSIFVGLKSKSECTLDERDKQWRQYREDDVKAALRKAFNAGKRWSQKEVSNFVANNINV